jgi:hypothetical protein
MKKESFKKRAYVCRLLSSFEMNPDKPSAPKDPRKIPLASGTGHPSSRLDLLRFAGIGLVGSKASRQQPRPTYFGFP